jgi:hypothetical protein
MSEGYYRHGVCAYGAHTVYGHGAAQCRQQLKITRYISLTRTSIHTSPPPLYNRKLHIHLSDTHNKNKKAHVPLPVCPYAKQEALPPSNKNATRGEMVRLYIISFVSAASNASSKVKDWVSIIFVRSTCSVG